MKRSMKTRTLRTVKAALSCFLSTSLALYMPVMAFAETYDLTQGNVTINTNESGEQKVTQEHTGVRDHIETEETVITSNGTETDNTVTINSAGTGDNVARVTLQDVNINARDGGAVSVNGSGDAAIELNGTNILQGHLNQAGIEDNLTGQLSINDVDNDGSLNVTGGGQGAGIGGGARHIMENNGAGDAGSNITINGGNITATGGTASAGIGGSLWGAGYNITITGGNVTAIGGGVGGAGIGGGASNNVGRGDASNITISGGTVTAIGGNYGAGIGGGMGGSGSNITISGGTVTAIGGITAAGIGGGKGSTGSNITISKDANVSAAGGGEDRPVNNPAYGAGAAIGNGSTSRGYGNDELEPGTEVDPIITGLYTTGSITIYEAGSTPEQIANEEATVVGETVRGTVQDPNISQPPADPDPVDPDTVDPDPVDPDPVDPDPVDPDPVDPDPVVPDPVNPDPVVPAPVNPSPETAGIIQEVAASTTAPATEQDADVAFNTAVDIQVDELLRQLYSLLETGRLDEANALIAKGFVINAGTHKGFDRVTLEKLGELSRAGVAVTINFTYAGVNYSVTIPAKSEIDPASLVDENGYCGFLNLMKYFG